MQHSILVPLIVMVLAGAELPTEGPVPVPKPEPATATDIPGPSDSQESRSDASDVKASPPATITTPEDSKAALALCESELQELGVNFERLEPVTGENGCGIASPYAIAAIAPGVTLKPATELRCETALSLARWVRDVVLPSARALPESLRLRAINHGSTYVCRRRNNLPTGKMSEHSIGNAIDIVSFEFDDREPLAVTPRNGKGSIEEAFQRAVRAGACLHFTTVLGPGADASHDNHLHFDIAKRRGGYRLCQ
ncbi:extensin family protein [Hoeflea sp.]|uniref:extensin-like domain-containing protein n=1 Tax=Hoeflea sp. TaxID=1940281 RepID=UPI00374982EE